MRRLFLALFALLVLCGAGSGALLWSYAHRPGPLEQGTDHVVPRGSSARIARDLAEARIIPAGQFSDYAFRLIVRLTRGQGALHAAELHFPARANIIEILHVLRHAQPVRHFLTVPEGLTVRQITTLLENQPLLSGPVPAFDEGALLPQTLAYERGTSRSEIVRRLEILMREALARVWAGRAPDPYVTAPQQLIVLASIVERETGNSAERPKVARVFLNRLARGMKLQSDPTAIYDLSGGEGVLDHGVTHDELHVPGPHNTYVIDGIPPTPICSPGLAALQAVAHPAEGDMLYFVADGHGAHGFSNDLKAHNQRIEALRSVRPAGVTPGNHR